MPRNGSGVYSLPAGSTFAPNTLIQSSVVNGINTDIATDMNTPRPVVAGGTGATTAAGAAAALSVLPLSGSGLIAMNGGPLESFRNQIINGDFTFWQRNTTQSTSGYGSDDRWSNNNVGTTKTVSQLAFALGQTTVPGNPPITSRTVVTSVAGASNFCNKSQKVEDVRILSGQQMTLTFYARADASKNISVEFSQQFGTGGSPSATVTGIGVATIALTTNFTRYDVLVTIPSISGKTLGSNGDHCTSVAFWFDAGSSFNSRTNSLGQQSGTFDIAHVSLVVGDARTETDPFSLRHVQQELALCQRYYEAGYIADTGYSVGGLGSVRVNTFLMQKRGIPSIALSNQTYTNASAAATSSITQSRFSFSYSITATGNAAMSANWTADAEL